MAKDEIKILQHQYEKRLLKKSIKLGLDKKRGITVFGDGKRKNEQCDTEEEFISQLQAKMEVFEEEVAKKVGQLAKGLAHLQRENLGMQRRITESVSQQNFTMQLDLLRSQFEGYQQVHTTELHHYSNKLQNARFEIENEVLSKLDEKLAQGSEMKGGAEMHQFKQEIYEYMQSKLKQLSKAYSPKFTTLFK